MADTVTPIETPQESNDTSDRHFEITLKFDIAQATARSLSGLLWNIGQGVQEVDINDVGRAGYAAVEEMVEAFEELQKYYESESSGGAQS